MERAEWYFRLQGLATGPYTYSQVIDFIKNRYLDLDTQIYSSSKKQWLPLTEIVSTSELPTSKHLGDYTEPNPPKYVPPIQKKPISWREKKKKFWVNRPAQSFIEENLPKIKFPDRPVILETGAAKFHAPNSSADSTILTLLEDVKVYSPSSAKTNEVEFHDPVGTSTINHYSRYLFYIFLVLAALFAIASYILTPTTLPLHDPKESLPENLSVGGHEENIAPTSKASDRSSETKAPDTPNEIPLKQPIRPKRD